MTNVSTVTITIRHYNFEDGAKLIVTRTARKGKQNKWNFTFFDAEQVVTTDSVTYEGNTWRWIDGEERANFYSKFHGSWEMKKIPSKKY